MSKFKFLVTIIASAMLILSCSQSDTESIGFELQPAFKAQLDKISFDSLTVVIGLDDSYSMHAKVNELSDNLEGMFKDLVDSGWEIDLHVVTCAYYKDQPKPMKSASTKGINGNQKKVAALMDKARPYVDLNTKDQDADERCNQSVKKAWSELNLENNVNISLIVSNEDDCSREKSQLDLPDLTGSTRSNCAPVTFGRVSAHSGKDLMSSSDSVWEGAVTSYSQKWLAFFNQKIKGLLHPQKDYVSFFNELNATGQTINPYFSHIYLPIVVDTNKCLASSLKAMAEKEQEEFMSNKASASTAASFRPQNTVGNIGYAYLDVFKKLQQNTLFSEENGDLSLCKDLSHVVDKIHKEIKLRGQGVTIKLSRRIDTAAMLSPKFKTQPIIKVTRPLASDMTEKDFARENQSLAAIGLKWVKVNKSEYELSLFLNTPFIKYDDKSLTLKIEASSYLSISSGDKVEIQSYIPKNFGDKASEIEFN